MTLEDPLESQVVLTPETTPVRMFALDKGDIHVLGAGAGEENADKHWHGPRLPDSGNANTTYYTFDHSSKNEYWDISGHCLRISASWKLLSKAFADVKLLIIINKVVKHCYITSNSDKEFLIISVFYNILLLPIVI